MYLNKLTSKGYINPPFNCWKLEISKREYFLWRKWKCRNGSDADFSTQACFYVSTQACFYVTMKYVDAGLEAVQQVLQEDYHDATDSILFYKIS